MGSQHAVSALIIRAWAHATHRIVMSRQHVVSVLIGRVGHQHPQQRPTTELSTCTHKLRDHTSIMLQVPSEIAA